MIQFDPCQMNVYSYFTREMGMSIQFEKAVINPASDEQLQEEIEGKYANRDCCRRFYHRYDAVV